MIVRGHRKAQSIVGITIPRQAGLSYTKHLSEHDPVSKSENESESSCWFLPSGPYLDFLSKLR